MSKPASIILGVLGVIALAIILGAFALRDRRPPPSPPEVREPVAAPALPSSSAAPERPIPTLAPSVAAVPRLRKPPEKDAGKHLDETSLLAKLHDLAASDPPQSLQLAKEAVARFPDSPNAPEFHWNVAKSLTNMGRFKEAQEEARVMVKKYPGNSLSNDVERHLLSVPLFNDGTQP